MQSTTKKRGVVLALVIGAVAIGIWLKWPHERLLTEIARPIVKVEVDQEKEQVAWISASQLLLVTTDRRSEIKERNDKSVDRNWQGAADLLNTTTGVRTRLSGLTALFQQVTAFPMDLPEEFEASQDGVWLSWLTFAGEHGRPSAHVAQLDGTHCRDVSSNSSAVCFFLDARHFVQMGPKEPALIVYDLLNPTKDRTYPRQQEAKAVLVHDTVQPPVFFRVSEDSKKGKEGYAEIDAYRTEDHFQELLNLGSGKDTLTPIRTWERKLPAGATFLLADVSSQQQSIYYHLQISQTDPLLDRLHRMFSTFDPKPKVTECLWVSRADGSGMHEIGHVPAKLDSNGDLDELLKDIKWLPNGKQISFVYHDILYVVPADS